MSTIQEIVLEKTVRAIRLLTFVLLFGLVSNPGNLHSAPQETQYWDDRDLPSHDLAYSREARAALAAHHLCSGLWVVGRVTKRTPEEILEQDIRPFRAFGWGEGFKYRVSYQHQTVTVNAPSVASRRARYNGDQGCSILPRGSNELHFRPTPLFQDLPDVESEPWPMGDVDANRPFPAGINRRVLNAALDWAMDQEQHNTRAILVVYAGKIIAEDYASGWTRDTPQIGWSKGKSITAALIGILIQNGHFKLDDPAPVREWQQEGDPRASIRIQDLLHMSSGLEFTNLGLSGPESYKLENEHMRIYADGLNIFDHAVNQPLEIPPNTQWRYRNSDPLTLGNIIRETIEARGENYLQFPQKALFDQIGARNFVLETDAWGNFVMTGYDYGTARDWARFALLHLWDGVWMGKRILPEGWVDFISTPAPADETKGYGGLFWLNRGGAMDRIPEDAFWASGFMGQTTMVIPSRKLIVVRMGPSPKGSARYLNELVGRIIDALPSN